MNEYFVPASSCNRELKVLNSRFIASITPAFSVEEARNFIGHIKQKYPDASHNVPAYLIGFGSTVISHCSDAGEPSGTAGRPALAVLNGSGLGDAALVITRYFGGTKLGSGGLVKAYSESARIVIEAVPKAKKILVHKGSIVCPYPLYDVISRAVISNKGTIVNEEFTDLVKIFFFIPIQNHDLLRNAVLELSNGKIFPELSSLNQPALLPWSDSSTK